MKKESVEDYAVYNYEQELDILNNITEAIKDDPDYAIEEESSLHFFTARLSFFKNKNLLSISRN